MFPKRNGRLRRAISGVLATLALSSVVLPPRLLVPAAAHAQGRASALAQGRAGASRMAEGQRVGGAAPTAEGPRMTGAPDRATSVLDLAARWNESCRRMERMIEDLPRHEFEVAALAAKLGSDPEVLFRWVRDHTRWVPYRGVLRGPLGVLLDRTGNSLDRALLLAELLRLGGHTARLARASIPEVELVGLLSRLPPGTRSGPAREDAARDGASEEGASEEGASREEEAREEPGLSVGSDAERALEDAIAAVRTQERAFAGALRGDPERETRSLLAALGDHWWVQVERPQGWIDLDPMLPEAEPGGAVTSATETLAPGEIPDDLRHRVRLRVVVERVDSGKREERVPLERVFFPADLLGKHITFFNRPLARLPEDAGGGASEEDLSPERMVREYDEVEEWLPSFLVDDETFTSHSVTTSGETNPKPNKTIESRKFSKAIEALTGPRRGQWTAEWLDYEVLSPGADPVRVRRQIFDLVGPARRAAGDLPDLARAQVAGRGMLAAGYTEIILPACRYGEALVKEKALRFHVDNRQATLGLLYALESEDDRVARTSFGRMRIFPAALYALEALRARWSPEPELSFYDRPNILSTHSSYGRSGEESLVARYSVDIVYNRMGVRPDALGRAARVRLVQGLADTRAETAVVPSSGWHNPSLLFEAARGQGVPVVLLAGPDDPLLEEIEIPADDRARILAALARGDAVAAPTRPVRIGEEERVGWWRISPETGETLGLGLNGWGISAVELQVLWYKAVYMIGPVGVLGWTIACAYTIAFWTVFALTAFGAPVPEIVNDSAMFGLMTQTWMICMKGRPGGGRPQLPGPKPRPQLPAPKPPPQPPAPRPPPRPLPPPPKPQGPGADREALKQHQLRILDWLDKEHGPV